ncbi:MAG: hypothetical protein AAFZ18_28490, partial [Myxococcota bacterium]
MVAAALRRLFDLRPGEGRMVTRSALSLFGLIAGHTMLETARDALFLSRIPADRLPIANLAVAGLSLGLARLVQRVQARLAPRRGVALLGL